MQLKFMDRSGFSSACWRSRQLRTSKEGLCSSLAKQQWV